MDMTRPRKNTKPTPSFARLFEATEIQGYDIHPDGRRAACSINTGDNYELAILYMGTGRTRKLLKGEQSMRSPTYSPSGTVLAFQADFEGNEDHDIFLTTPEGKRCERLTGGNADNQDPHFSPDGRKIAFISNRDDDMENLFVIDLSGRSVSRLSREEVPVRTLAWSPDGERIAYASGIGDEDYVSVADVGTGKVKRVLSKKNVEYGAYGDFGPAPSPWSRDGSRLLFTSNEDDQFDIGELDLGSGRTKWLVRSKNEKQNPQWSPDGRSLSYLEVEEPDVLLKVRSGRTTKVLSPRGGVTRSVQWLPDGKGIAMINGSSVMPEELFVTTSSRPRRVTRFQRRPIPSSLLVRPKVVSYRSFDGRNIHALLFEPRDRRRRAGIVMPHGGPEMQSANVWDQIIPMFTTRGFYVIEPNYRGSTGYGREFLHLHDKDLGGGDLMDTILAGKYLVDQDLADEDKLGFWGVSYGGYLCMMALTKAPDMWAAGVSIVGFFDWETEMATERGFLKAYDRKKMGDPVKDREFFRERSPAYFLQNLRAPLMMTASARDVRCPPTESRAVVKRLKGMGKECVYHEYRDEGHWPRKRKNLMDLYTRTSGFLDERISGQAHDLR